MSTFELFEKEYEELVKKYRIRLGYDNGYVAYELYVTNADGEIIESNGIPDGKLRGQ